MPMPDEGPSCICASLDDLAVIPMGGDGLDERYFATIDTVRDYGDERWWLHSARCSACGQDWLIAQEERIYDDHFIRRLTRAEADAITGEGIWPHDFHNYEALLRLGRDHGRAWTFLDPRSSTLVQTAEDLRRDRPGISTSEIGELLGITTEHADRLLRPRTWLDRLLRR